MGSSKVIHALYTDDDVLLAAVKAVKDKKHHIEEIFTPFPVHGLDKAMGLEPTRIAIARCHQSMRVIVARRSPLLLLTTWIFSP